MRVWPEQTMVVRERRGGQPVCEAVFSKVPAAKKNTQVKNIFAFIFEIIRVILFESSRAHSDCHSR